MVTYVAYATVDEGHRLKNEKSQLSEKLRVVPALSKIILTGFISHNSYDWDRT
jgi:SNF2 family DNA or RNA helicase